MRLALPVLFSLFSALLHSQAAKPDFTGTYELDRTASQEMGERQARLRVEHHEPKLRYTYQGRDRTQEFNLTTDGTDQVRDEPKGESRMTAKWDGGVLEVRSFLKSKEGETTTVERWSAEPKGVLTIQTRSTMKAGGTSNPEDRESTLVFRKKR